MREPLWRTGMDKEGETKTDGGAAPPENAGNWKRELSRKDPPGKGPVGSVADRAPAHLPVERTGSRAVPGPASAAGPGAVPGADHLLHPLQVGSAEPCWAGAPQGRQQLMGQTHPFGMATAPPPR